MIKRDSKEQFIAMIQKHQDIIHKISFFYSDQPEDRKDLEQEIIYQLWKSYPSFRHQSLLTTWMYRIALNTAILDLRNRKKRPEKTNLTDRMLDIQARPEPDGDDVQRLFNAIEQLRKVDRAIILLYLEKKSYEEIALIIGLTGKNVSVRLVRIKEKLRTLLTPSVRNQP